MANEINVGVNLRCSNGTFVMPAMSINKQLDQSSAGGDGPGVVAVGTSEETISFGDITPGLVLMQNLDTTNFVNYGTATGELGLKLTAGNEPALIYLDTGTSLIMQADTASCNVLIKALNA